MLVDSHKDVYEYIYSHKPELCMILSSQIAIFKMLLSFSTVQYKMQT